MFMLSNAAVPGSTTPDLKPVVINNCWLTVCVCESIN